MSFHLIFPKISWCEFLHILSFLEYDDKIRCGSVNKSAHVHITLREKSLRQATATFPSRFLPSGYRQERVLLMSYPRSGNSYLRQLLEQTTGIVTGSDSRSNRPLAASLIRCGFKGEGVIDSSVWVVKSHYPERLGYVKCRGQRVILLVRNPFDAIESYFHMGLTNTHDKSLTDEVFERYSDMWAQCVRNEAKVWVDFHRYWLSNDSFDLFRSAAAVSRKPLHKDEDNESSSSSDESNIGVSDNEDIVDLSTSARVPTLVVRYEDLLANPAETMQEINSFLDAGSPPDHLCRLRKRSIRRAPTNRVVNVNAGIHSTEAISSSDRPRLTDTSANTSANTNASLGYRPKGGGIGKGLRRMDARLVRDVLKTPHMKKYLKLFGYDIVKSEIAGCSSDNRGVSSGANGQECMYQIKMKESGVGRVENSTVSSCKGGSATVTAEGVLINETFSIRSPDDPFGRNFTYTRHEITDNDTVPLPTVSRLK